MRQRVTIHLACFVNIFTSKNKVASIIYLGRSPAQHGRRDGTKDTDIMKKNIFNQA